MMSLNRHPHRVSTESPQPFPQTPHPLFYCNPCTHQTPPQNILTPSFPFQIPSNSSPNQKTNVHKSKKNPEKKTPGRKILEVFNTHSHLYLTSFTQHPHNQPHRHSSLPSHRLLTIIHTPLSQLWTSHNSYQTSFQTFKQTLCPLGEPYLHPLLPSINVNIQVKNHSNKSEQNRIRQ